MPAETHSHRGPIDADEVAHVVREQLAEILGIDVDAVTLDARLREDLDADDYALIDLVEAVEVELGERMVGLSIDDDLAELDTVGDVVTCVVASFDEERPRPASAPAEGVDYEVPDGIDMLEQRLGVEFTDRRLLLRALAHRSWCSEQAVDGSNERLEFLGDSVLGLVVTEYAYERFPHLPEGQLSEVRASVVNASVLAEVASELDLGTFLLLGKGEDAAGGRTKQSILADAFEAVIAAVYLEAGLERARDVVLACMRDRIAEAAAGPGGRDYKTRLQEWTAAHGLGRPRYVVRDDGPDHDKRFYATVHVADRQYGEGEGRSKKQAEQAAAWVAWTRLREEGGDDAGAA